MHIIAEHPANSNTLIYWIIKEEYKIGPFRNPFEASAALLRYRRMDISVEDQICNTYFIKIGELRFGKFDGKDIAYQNISRILSYPVEILSCSPRKNADDLWDIRVGCGYIGPFDSSEEAWHLFQTILEQQIKIEVHDVGAANEKWTLSYGEEKENFDTEEAIVASVCKILGLDIHSNVIAHPPH